jgi:hypothetical protein
VDAAALRLVSAHTSPAHAAALADPLARALALSEAHPSPSSSLSPSSSPPSLSFAAAAAAAAAAATAAAAAAVVEALEDALAAAQSSKYLPTDRSNDRNALSLVSGRQLSATQPISDTLNPKP